MKVFAKLFSKSGKSFRQAFFKRLAATHKLNNYFLLKFFWSFSFKKRTEKHLCFKVVCREEKDCDVNEHDGKRRAEPEHGARQKCPGYVAVCHHGKCRKTALGKIRKPRRHKPGKLSAEGKDCSYAPRRGYRYTRPYPPCDNRRT